jgi:tripartite ATP-independent transporter DctM subunit
LITALVGLLLAVLLFVGMPVGFALAVSGAAGLWLMGGTSLLIGILDTAPLSSVASYELITIPMFILMAEFVILSGVADDLFKAAATWVGRVPGGLGIATAFAGAGFGAISGSSTASAATLSATTIPAMLRHNYEPKLACGVVAISGTLAMLIPPSIALVLYGIIADVSIGKLLIGGVIPGIMITLTIALTVLYLVWRDPSRAPAGPSYTWREKLASLTVAGPMIVLFAAVTGVIYVGIATPTEAAGLGAAGAFLLALWQGKLTPKTTLHALKAAAVTTCMILMIILGAKIFGYFFTLTQVTQELVRLIASLPVSRYVVLTLILAIYFILGCIMDQVAILILTVPVILPVMQALGFDPVWFGVIVILMAEIGLVTPPLGLNVFVVAKYTGRPLQEIFAGVWPHVFAHLIAVALMCAFPQIILWLPSKM